MARTRELLPRVRRICTALPGVEESSRLGGQPHFYVDGRIFAGCGIEDGVWTCGMKVGLELQSVLVTRPGFHVAKYVGRYGWISVEESALVDDAELERLIHISYELIAGEAPCKTPAAKGGKRGAAAKGAAKSQPKSQTMSKPQRRGTPVRQQGKRASR